ncbi:unnamed protein product [Prorocentrum cordatum]|uniref:Uncharacterized protein n=1 Tax=Prorocentrum cordatum TaxID=2364126 RepID=A0ABN9UCU6_9DINO|nr:unnamed protein product [Polarella glacialis]
MSSTAAAAPPAAASSRHPWLRVAALIGAGALVALELLLRRRRQRAPPAGLPGAAARAPPAGLLRALRRRECVAALGPEFPAPALPGSSLQGLLIEAVRGAMASPGGGGREPLEAGAAAAVLARLSAAGLPLSDAELLVGDACAAVGRRRLWRGAAAAQRRLRAGGTMSRRVQAAVADCLGAVEAVPFAAVLASSWGPEAQERFPCTSGATSAASPRC